MQLAKSGKPSDEARSNTPKVAQKPKDGPRQKWNETARKMADASRKEQAQRDADFNRKVGRTLTQDIRELSTQHDGVRSERLHGQGVEIASGKTITVDALTKDLDTALAQIDEFRSTHPKLHTRQTGHIQDAKTAISDLSAKDSKYSMATKVAAGAVANLPLMALPLLLATDPAKIKDVSDGESRLSKDFLMLMAGYQAKSIALLASHASSPLSNPATLKRGVVERQAYDVLSFVSGAPAAFSKTVQDGFGSTTGHSLARGTFLVGTLNGVFQSDSIGKFGNRVVSSLQSLARDGTTNGATSYPRLERLAKGLSKPQMQTLSAVANALKEIAQDLQDANSALVKDGILPSPTYTEHNRSALTSMFKAAEEMEHIGAPQPSENGAAAANNPDRNEKALIFAVTAAVYAANLALVYNDPLALVDTAADAGVVLPIIYSSVNDPAINATGAKDRFKSFAGTTLLAAFLLGADRAAGRPTESNDKVFYAMLGVFAAASLTLPSPVAGKFVGILEKAVQCCGRAATDVFEDGSDSFAEVFTDDPNAADARARVIEEGLELVASVAGEGDDRIPLQDLGDHVGNGLDALLFAAIEIPRHALTPNPRITELSNFDPARRIADPMEQQNAARRLGLDVPNTHNDIGSLAGTDKSLLSETNLTDRGAEGQPGLETLSGGPSEERADDPGQPFTGIQSIFEIAAQGRTPMQIEEERKRAQDPNNIV